MRKLLPIKPEGTISQLKIKLIVIMMVLFTVVLTTLMISNTLLTGYISTAENLRVVQAALNGELQQDAGGLNIPARRTNQYFALVDDNGNIETLEGVSDGTYTDEEVQQFVLEAVQSVSFSGVLDDHDMYYATSKTENGTVVVLLDGSAEREFLSFMQQSTLTISGGGLLLLLVLAFVLANWLTDPVRRAFEHQRQFIADASHELKTPIATISANIDILTEQQGQNKWLGFIKDETVRMKSLVTDLLYLASGDAQEVKLHKEPFNLSDTVALTSMSFESRFYEGGRRLNLDIAPDLTYTGDEMQIKQLVAILLDNASTHTPSGGEIEVSISKVQNKITLTVKNTGEGIADSEREKIFERFYRSDSSRARGSGGYGLGLSIARQIAKHHGAKITAGGVVGSYAEFKVVF